METVFALASGPGIAAIAVIRVTGPAAASAVAALTGRAVPAPRRASQRRLIDATGHVLDEALVLWFPGPASATGEDLAELHCHGSRAVVDGVLAALAAVPGCTAAEPGEFTRRAFLNGKLDLVKVEALGDLLTAETEAQRHQALGAFGGGLSALADTWRRSLATALALVEATIDWADEDVPQDVSPEVRQRIDQVAVSMAEALAGQAAAMRLRDGYEVVLIGAPNAGKSTLLNAVAGHEAAITAAEPGTTRDFVEVSLSLDGLPVTLVDTAGLRSGDDVGAVEATGIARTLTRAAAADLRLFLDAPDAPLPGEAAALWHDGDLSVAVKGDLMPRVGAVSAVTGAGLPELRRTVAGILGERASRASSVISLRQRGVVGAAAEALARATSQGETELLAEELRAALAALEHLTGRTSPDDVLAEVFGRFCLGK
ncbi:MAG: tRNA uridine-5-carboxymethylaminomethyl(34) synthesis GTPase MnmE [Pseudomonadota bacterium]